MANEITIPALPCPSIKETLDFYVALGFEITYQQARPNTYGCVQYEDIQLHFFTLKGIDPTQSYSTCVVVVPSVDAIYQVFAANLRQNYGKLPIAGIPRISKPNNNNAEGNRRFNIIDPGGNWIRFSERVESPTIAEEGTPSQTEATKLSRATRAAKLLADSKGDYAAAAKMLDAALAEGETESKVHYVQALVTRAAIAVTLEDQTLAQQMLTTLRQMSLDADERAALMPELQEAGELEESLSE